MRRMGYAVMSDRDEPDLDSTTILEMVEALRMTCETMYTYGPWTRPIKCTQRAVTLAVLVRCQHSVPLCGYHYAKLEQAMLDPECAGARCAVCGVPSSQIRLENLK